MVLVPQSHNPTVPQSHNPTITQSGRWGQSESFLSMSIGCFRNLLKHVHISFHSTSGICDGSYPRLNVPDEWVFELVLDDNSVPLKPLVITCEGQHSLLWHTMVRLLRIERVLILIEWSQLALSFWQYLLYNFDSKKKIKCHHVPTKLFSVALDGNRKLIYFWEVSAS